MYFKVYYALEDNESCKLTGVLLLLLLVITNFKIFGRTPKLAITIPFLVTIRNQ